MPHFHVLRSVVVNAYYKIEALDEQGAITIASSNPLMEYASSSMGEPKYTVIGSCGSEEAFQPVETKKPTD